MRVKQLADKLGITPDTIRYYTRIGLLHPSKDSSGYRQYNARERQFLRFAIRAKQLGFSLSAVKEIVDLAKSGKSPCPRVRELMEENIVTTERSYREMQALRRRMLDAVEAWADMPDSYPDGDTICGLIEDWDTEVG